MMKNQPIEKFGTKLFVASQSINKIPAEYLRYSENARIRDGGIGPRRGKQLFTDSTLGTNNKGGFLMGGKLYQIANSKIYEISSLGVQTDKVNLGYNKRTDTLTYNNFTIIASEFSRLVGVFNGTSIDTVSTSPGRKVGDFTVTIATPAVFTLDNHGLEAGDWVYLTTTGSLPSGVDIASRYTVSADGLTTNTFKLSTIAGIVNTSGTQSGVHTLFKYGNSGIIEYCRGFSFIAVDNVLYISRPITPTNPEYAYDWTGSGSQTITYDSKIKGLKGTMNGLYVFTEDKIEFLGANALQNVAGASAFISTPLGDGGELMDNQLIATSGDKVFYVTKNLNINTINYVQGTAEPGLGELSNQPVISIRELMQTLDIDQPSGFAFVNDNDSTIQFHLRTINSPFNDICIVYDIINTTWNIDTGKNYNFVLRNGAEYLGFSDINTSIYKDDVGTSNAGVPINFKIVTQDISYGTMLHKNFGGFFTAGAIDRLSILEYKVLIDNEEVFIDNIVGGELFTDGIGEIAGTTIGGEPMGGDLSINTELTPFDFTADVGRIYQAGIRCRIEISSQSLIQNFIIDILGIIAEQTMNTDIKNKF